MKPKNTATVDEIRLRLQGLGEQQRALFLQRFFKTGPGGYGEGDVFLGVRIPELRKLAGEYHFLTLPEVLSLLHSPIHEERLFALLVLVRKYSKEAESAREEIYRMLLANTAQINSWDLVDLSAPPIVGAHLLKRDRSPLFQLAQSKNLWERRLAVMATFHFIRHHDYAETLLIVELLLSDKEDLIHKAAGWMLREVGKRDFAAAERFLDRHWSRMPRTMLRYAIEKFPQAKRQKYARRRTAQAEHDTKPMNKRYVHGYDLRENLRLQDQASTLVELLHSDTSYPAGSRVLEAGCGVGAQTGTLCRNSPEASITSIDISEVSLAEARRQVTAAGLTNVRFQQGDIFQLPFPPESFDHVFVCFVLEHLARPIEALKTLRTLLKTGGTITVIEGDHGSTYFHPDSEVARQAIQCQVELQQQAGGNALIGRELYPLLRTAGFDAVRVSPRMVYVDASRPALVEGFTKKTFTAMIEGVREAALEAGLIDQAAFDRGIRDLYRTTEADGVFCYTFFKAVARKG